MYDIVFSTHVKEHILVYNSLDHYASSPTMEIRRLYMKIETFFIPFNTITIYCGLISCWS